MSLHTPCRPASSGTSGPRAAGPGARRPAAIRRSRLAAWLLAALLTAVPAFGLPAAAAPGDGPAPAADPAVDPTADTTTGETSLPQQADPPAEPDPLGTFGESVAVSWALVPVLVRTGNGYLDDLERDDFRLFVDDREVPIADFESGATAPVSLVFLQDLSGSMANGGKLIESRRALAYLLSKARPDDEFAVATFAGEQLQVEVPFTREEQVLAEAMELWEGYGTTALHDAVAWIPQITSEGRHPKRAVVLISDGVDNASRIDAERAREIIGGAQLPVYVLGLGRERLTPDEGSSYAQLLRELARASGGHYFPVEPGEEVYRAAARLLEELRRQYVLAFPTGPGDQDHLVRVEVDTDRRVDVYHRRGYRGGPPVPGRF